MARRLTGKGWKVYGYDAKRGLGGVNSLKELSGKLSPQRIIWLMLPPGKPIEEILFGFGIGAYWSGVYEHLAWHRSN